MQTITLPKIKTNFKTFLKELLELQSKIDKQIDEMVYRLYGLSEDEVAVVEGVI